MPPTHLHLWQNWHSLQINYNTSLWSSNHIQPPSQWETSAQSNACIHGYLACNWEATLTTTMLQDIPMFNGQQSSKLEDWFMDIKTIIDILRESHTHLAEAKSCGLICTLIGKAVHEEKCWDEIKSILRLKLCNANIHTYTSHLKEIQQKDNETLAASIHCFKMAAKWCAFDSDTTVICIFVKGLWDVHTTAAYSYKKDPQTLSEVIRLVGKTQCSTTTNSHTDCLHGQYDA